MSGAGRLRGMGLPLCLALWGCTWSTHPVLGPPEREGVGILESPVKDCECGAGTGWDISHCEDRLRELGLFILEKSRLGGFSSISINT